MLFVSGNNLSGAFRNYFNVLAKSRPDFKPLLADIGHFRSLEPFSELLASPAGQDVVLLQSTSGRVAESCMELLLTTATLKRYGAKSVTVAIPFAAFGRQDKAPKGRYHSVAADDFPKLLKAAGADKIITAEVHSKAAEQFYIDCFGADNVTFVSNVGIFADDIKKTFGAFVSDIVLGAPDGADKPDDSAQIRAREVAMAVHDLTALSADDESSKILKIWKTHTGVNTTKVLNFSDNVRNRHAVIIDDMSDTGGTALNSCRVLKENGGAVHTTVYLSHGLFDVRALHNILGEKFASGHMIDQLVVSDTVPDIEGKLSKLSDDNKKRVRILPTAPLFAEKILALHI